MFTSIFLRPYDEYWKVHQLEHILAALKKNPLLFTLVVSEYGSVFVCTLYESICCLKNSKCFDMTLEYNLRIWLRASWHDAYTFRKCLITEPPTMTIGKRPKIWEKFFEGFFEGIIVYKPFIVLQIKCLLHWYWNNFMMMMMMISRNTTAIFFLRVNALSIIRQ